MTREDEGHYGDKHPEGVEVNREVIKAVEGKAKDGKITCAACFKIAEEQKVAPLEVGAAVDSLEIKLIKCQIGMFGYSPGKKSLKIMENVEEGLKKDIEKESREGEISCKGIWDIAVRLNIPKTDVASACDRLQMKISSCQLGAF